ncbi:MAG: hypothetical protein QXT63_03950 [Thermoplasmata archaeon]
MKRPRVEKTTYWISENEVIESITIEDENKTKYAHTYKKWDKSIGWRAIARWDNMLGEPRGLLLCFPEKEIEKCKDLKEVLKVVLEKSSAWGNGV